MRQEREQGPGAGGWESRAGRLCRLLSVGCLLLSGCSFFHSPPPYLPPRDSVRPGQTITVKNSENIYAIAHEHNVSMRDLIVLNNLHSPYEVRPGQAIILPADSSGNLIDDLKPPDPAPLAPVEKNQLAPIMAAPVASEVLQPITVAPAAPVAPIAPPAASAAPQSLTPQALTPHASPAPQTLPSLPPPSQTPTPVAAPVASSNKSAPPIAPVTATDAPAMIWPVQGPVLSKFGPKGPGLNNDGVNIAAPKGSAVVAAAAGTVVYAGGDMKGFGNLILIRHQGNWVTAYAHLDRILVKKDAIVDQGDQIGTVGKTGNVSAPQLHFEVRQGEKPVDPASVVKG